MSDDLYPEVPNYPEGDDVLARLTWWRGHGERIRDFDPHGTCEEFDAVPVADLFDAADEIERLRRLVEDLRAYAEEDACVFQNLRALITAWVDAHDTPTSLRSGDVTATERVLRRRQEADMLLRRAVGR